MPEPSAAPTEGSAPRGLRLWEILTLTDETDETGRLLLEDSAPKRAQKNVQRQGVRMKPVRCTYNDTTSRQGGLMNVSAYEALRHDTAGILNGFAWLGDRYLEDDPARRGTVRALFDVSYLGLTLPILLFRRAVDPVPAHGRLPSYIASMYKASRGVFSAAVGMLNELGPEHRLTGQEALRFADEHGHLKRAQTQRVCAAPARLIERTLAVMLREEAADPTKSELGALVDFSALWAFYALQEGFSQALSEYGFVLGKLTENGPFRDHDELFDAVVPVDGGRRRFGELTEAMVARAAGVQAEMNRLLGRGDHPRPIAFDDLMRML